MQLGMIGLGRMGGNMVRRLMRGGHTCVVYDRDPEAVDGSSPKEGATGAESLDDFVAKLAAAARGLGDGAGRASRPSRPCRRSASGSSAGDTIIDGGNSYFKDDVRRAKELEPKGIHYVDVGTSGGVWGLERGYCLMIGGPNGGGRAARADLHDAGARARRDRADPGPRRREQHRRGGLPPLRARRARATS